uniref:Uncharacterized protein n=1 Tax=Arundo donax TaxID=35708 RepID=A0A0A9F1I3_ARUDO
MVRDRRIPSLRICRELIHVFWPVCEGFPFSLFLLNRHAYVNFGVEEN